MLKDLRAGALLVGSLLAASGVNAIAKVSRSGRYLYTDDGNRFYIKGIAYQEQGEVTQSDDNPFGEPSTFVDSLSNADGCNRDLPYLKDLGVNTIRAYSVDSSLNHDACMKAFSDAGIYTIIDLSLPLNGSIDRTSPSWSTNVLDLYTRTIDTFSKYDNVLAYNVGNEVVVEGKTAVAPYVKAAARDIKAYLTSKSSSALVGYAAIDGNANWRVALANFLSCDPSGSNSDSTSIDLYGLNNYEWCGDDTLSAYDNSNSLYAGYNVAAYFSEYGCVREPPRLWTEAGALLSSDLSTVWSGGVAFSYFPAASADGQFGMVTISDDKKSVQTSDDYNRLKEQYGKVNPPNDPSKSSAGTSSYPSCPSTNDTWVASTKLPPTPNEAACDCLEDTLSCRFRPPIADYSATLGQLVNAGCSLLGEKGLSCNDIGGDGQNGTYGRLAGCDPTIKLSYVMSQYYEANDRNPQSCDFSGNATINTAAPPSVSAANAAASSCISDPSSVFTPSSAPSSGGGGNGAASSTPTTNNPDGGAMSLFADQSAITGMFVMLSLTLGSAFWTLL